MRWNLGLKRQLLLGMTALMLLFVTTTLLALWQLNTMSAQLQRVVKHDAPKAALAHQLLAALLDVGMQERTLLPLTDSEDLKVQYATLQNALGHYRAVEQQLTALAADGSAGALGAQLATIRRERAQAEPVHARAMELVVNGAGAEAGLTLLLQVERADASWRKSIATIVDQVGASNQAIYQHDQLRSSQARQLLMCALALAIGSGTLLALKLARHVTLPVAHATSVASAIAAGDLTSRVTQHRRDELGRLLGAVGAMQDKLRHIVSNLRHSAAAIEDASCQVADGSTALSRGTALAASALQTTTASLHTLADTVQASAESARRASACTQEVRTKAEQGNLVMVRVQDSMRKVDQATRKIDGIVGMISEIAFQTNILALNAAVEAARAGPQGRGFAVVAGEVRTLAQRAAQAAAQISDLSREASGSISDSNSQVQHAAAMAIVLMDQADIVATLVADVSATATSQSDALHGIQQAMARLDGVTRQNADISAAAVGTAAALAHQSHELIRMVSMFRVDAASTASATTEAVALQFASGSATD